MQAHVLGGGKANEVYIRADKMTSRRVKRSEHTETKKERSNLNIIRGG